MSVEKIKSNETMSTEEMKSYESMSIEEMKSNEENMSVEEMKSIEESMSIEEMKSNEEKMSVEEIPSPDKDYRDDKMWKLHDLYESGVSFGRIMTRSQTAFARINNTKSDMDLFGNREFHQPQSMKHVIETMKGTYGAIPRTSITRSASRYLKVSAKLCRKLESYKTEMRKKKGTQVYRRRGNTALTKNVDRFNGQNEIMELASEESLAQVQRHSANENDRLNGKETPDTEPEEQSKGFMSFLFRKKPSPSSSETKKEPPVPVREQSSYSEEEDDDKKTAEKEPEEKPRGFFSSLFRRKAESLTSVNKESPEQDQSSDSVNGDEDGNDKGTPEKEPEEQSKGFMSFLFGKKS